MAKAQPYNDTRKRPVGPKPKLVSVKKPTQKLESKLVPAKKKLESKKK